MMPPFESISGRSHEAKSTHDLELPTKSWTLQGLCSKWRAVASSTNVDMYPERTAAKLRLPVRPHGFLAFRVRVISVSESDRLSVAYQPERLVADDASRACKPP